jgi:hypothetical protein
MLGYIGSAERGELLAIGKQVESPAQRHFSYLADRLVACSAIDSDDS